MATSGLKDKPRIIGVERDPVPEFADQRGQSPIVGRTQWFFSVGITHLPTAEHVGFEGWVTDFSDTYTSQWNEQQVYGRMDPLSTYQGTQRRIHLAFDIVNDSKSMAEGNLRNIGKFLKFQYPVYTSAAQSAQNTLKGAPLLALKWTNLISSPNNPNQQLVGYINGPVSYAPDVSEGGFMTDSVVFHVMEEEENIKQIRNYIPKKVSLSFDFTVLHTHLVGWAPELGNSAEPDSKTTYYFGGTPDINDRYPNVYTEFPPPAYVTTARANRDAAAAAEEEDAEDRRAELGSDPEFEAMVDEEVDEAVAGLQAGTPESDQLIADIRERERIGEQMKDTAALAAQGAYLMSLPGAGVRGQPGSADAPNTDLQGPAPSPSDDSFTTTTPAEPK